MAEILHQLRLVVFPIIYKVLYIPGGCLGFQPSTVVAALSLGFMFLYSHSPVSVGWKRTLQAEGSEDGTPSCFVMFCVLC